MPRAAFWNEQAELPLQPDVGDGGDEGSRSLRVHALCLNLDCFTAHLHGKALPLTRLEFDILLYLAQQSHRLVSNEEIMRQVVRGVYRPESSLVRVHISHLRRKLGAEAGLIGTVRGRGFRLLRS